MDNRILIPERAESLAKSDNTHRNAVICILVVATLFIGMASSLFNSDALNNTLSESDEEKVDLLFNKKPGEVKAAQTNQVLPTSLPTPSTTPTPTIAPSPTTNPTPTTQPTSAPTSTPVPPTNTPEPTIEPTHTPTPSISPTPTDTPNI